MRLSTEYLHVFINAFADFLPIDGNAELRLFGSRVHNDLKGGDIDLLLITETKTLATQLKQKKPALFARIFSSIDEQKIDLLIIDTASLNDDPFAKQAFKQSILLKKWGKEN
jgi:predicted nucleotidyltransferase